MQDATFTDIYGNTHKSALELVRVVLKDLNVQNYGGRLEFDDAAAVHHFISGTPPDPQQWEAIKNMAVRLLLTSPTPLLAVDLHKIFNQMETPNEDIIRELTERTERP